MLLQLKQSDYTEPNYSGLYRPQAEDNSVFYLLGSLLLIGGLVYYKSQQEKEKKPVDNGTTPITEVKALGNEQQLVATK